VGDRVLGSIDLWFPLCGIGAGTAQSKFIVLWRARIAASSVIARLHDVNSKPGNEVLPSPIPYFGVA